METQIFISPCKNKNIFFVKQIIYYKIKKKKKKKKKT